MPSVSVPFYITVIHTYISETTGLRNELGRRTRQIIGFQQSKTLIKLDNGQACAQAANRSRARNIFNSLESYDITQIYPYYITIEFSLYVIENRGP